MKVMRLHGIGESLQVDRIKVPQLIENEVLVKARASGICHSDLNNRDGVSTVDKLPIILAKWPARLDQESTFLPVPEGVVAHHVPCGLHL
jgi:threonine dehydrogenase-like Zn-dependent dehydrogenase